MSIVFTGTVAGLIAAMVCSAAVAVIAQHTTPQLPTAPLQYGFFTIRFAADGAFTLEGKEWPPFNGAWTVVKDELTVTTTGGPEECPQPGRYRFRVENMRLSLVLLSDDCGPRRMVLKDSTWGPEGSAAEVTPRTIVRRGPERAPTLPEATSAKGSWPSFRGPHASGVADGQHLPDRWDGKTGENILWRTPIAGLAHSSPVVWGNQVFVTSAISGRPDATFKPGLYGDGDSSEDLSPHRWVLYAIDKRTGKVDWERVAFEGVPRERRHIKSTYASASPATDGRIVVGWFGSHGVHAYDVAGHLLWTVDLGRVDMGAYDIPSYQWGPASSPIIWNDLVLLQCDTQTDAFVLALDAKTGETVWKTGRDELPSWGTPTVVTTTSGVELVTNGSKFIGVRRPHGGRAVASRRQLQDYGTHSCDGRRPRHRRERPEAREAAVRGASRRAGRHHAEKDKTSSAAIAWSRSGRGPYMPTPLIYDGVVYALNNDGVFDAYDVQTGHEIYRQRLKHLGSGFSASPVAADSRIYLSNEDGEIIVIAAGREFREIATNPMGELLMATPALSDGVMYVRSSSALSAIGTRR